MRAIFRFFGLAFSVALFSWIALFCVYLFYVFSYTQVIVPEVRVAVVLTGSSDRIPEGLKLLSQNKIDQLFISGVHKDSDIDDIQNFYDDAKYMGKKIILGHLAQNTLENASEVSDWIKKNKVKSFYLVTANYHMVRSMLEMKHAVQGTHIIPYPTTRHSLFQMSSQDVHQFVSLLVKEFHKSAYVFLKNL